MGFSEALGARRQRSIVDVADNSTVVYAGRAQLIGIVVNTALSAHVLPILDGSTTVLTLPASAAAGSFFDCYGCPFDTSLVVDPNDAATGAITLVFDPVGY
jgi:hypothetical protein